MIPEIRPTRLLMSTRVSVALLSENELLIDKILQGTIFVEIVLHC